MDRGKNTQEVLKYVRALILTVRASEKQLLPVTVEILHAEK